MVFRRRRASKGAIIDSVKHEIRYSALLATGGSTKQIKIAEAKNTADITAGVDSDVKTGCIIKALIFESNYNFEGNVTAVVDWQIVKLRSGQSPTVDFNPATPNLPTRSQIFLSGMEMPAGINNSSSIKRIGTLLIPKGKQRMSEGDIWYLLYRTTAGANAEDACGKFIFKEYR